MKQCTLCKAYKPLLEFNKHNKSKSGYQGYCKDCQKAWFAGGDYWLQSKYGITLKQKNQMIADQGHCCDVCKKPLKSASKSHVDHCHTTLKLRGILCSNCNTALGLVNESLETLDQLKEYITRHAEKTTAPPIPTRANRKGSDDSQLRIIFTSRTGEDDDHAHNHCGADAGKDVDHSAKKGSGDGLGRGSKEVVPLEPFTRIENHGEPEPEIVRFEFGSGDLFD